jgi:hypothetical protein
MRAYDLTPVAGACPICQSTRAVRLYAVTAVQSANHFLRREVDPDRHAKMLAEIQRLWGGPSCTIIRCRQCSFVYAFPYVAGRETFYSLFLSSPSYPQNRFEFGQTAAILKARCGTAGPALSLLEVGAGDGAFLRQVSPALVPQANILCTEFSAAGATTLRALGFACEMADVRTLRNPRDQHRFSAICMFQVLEHLDDLDGLWEAFNRLAAPHADLFLAVPNDAWIEYHERHEGQLDMPPNHVGRWNRTAFETIGRRHGWELRAHVVQSATRRSFLRQIAASRFFQARQTPNTWSDRTTRIANRRLRRMCSLPMYAVHCAASLPLAMGANLSHMGDTQWAHLHKTS